MTVALLAAMGSGTGRSSWWRCRAMQWVVGKEVQVLDHIL